MSYPDGYTTPKACYVKAPVRRESIYDAVWRTHTQPLVDYTPFELESASNNGSEFTTNATLIPGKASHVKVVTQGSRFGALK